MHLTTLGSVVFYLYCILCHHHHSKQSKMNAKAEMMKMKLLWFFFFYFAKSVYFNMMLHDTTNSISCVFHFELCVTRELAIFIYVYVQCALAESIEFKNKTMQQINAKKNIEKKKQRRELMPSNEEGSSHSHINNRAKCFIFLIFEQKRSN